MKELDDLHTAVLERNPKKQVRFADRAWKALKRYERSKHRPGQQVVEGFVCGLILGVSITAMVWMAVTGYYPGGGRGQTTTQGTPDVAPHPILDHLSD